jgi:hypothetical protein
MSPSVPLPKDDMSKIVDTLIDNQQIKDIIMKTSLSNFDATEVYGRHQQLDQQRLQQGRKEESGLEKLMLNK